MSRPESRNEYRREMAEAFAGVLEERGLEWRKEWMDSGAPRNGVTSARYKGSNAFWLGLRAVMKGYDDPRWVTMVQIMDRESRYHPGEKWHLKAGSEAVYVEYWYPYDIKAGKAVTWDRYREELDRGRDPAGFRLSARYTAVFNACDVEGMPEFDRAGNTDVEMDGMVRTLSQNMGVPIMLDGGDQAYYSLRRDMIHLPRPETFESGYAFNSAALHELAHATGHPSRLNRLGSMATDREGYAYEELVAEMSSCFMGWDLGTRPDSRHAENHRAYVQMWIRSVRGKPETLILAIKDAQRTADYMGWKAGLMTDLEYEASKRGVMEIKKRDRDMSR